MILSKQLFGKDKEGIFINDTESFKKGCQAWPLYLESNLVYKNLQANSRKAKKPSFNTIYIEVLN
jgi:hypothetical protein